MLSSFWTLGDKATPLPNAGRGLSVSALTHFELVRQHTGNRLFGPALFDAHRGIAYQIHVDLSFLLSLFSRLVREERVIERESGKWRLREEEGKGREEMDR